MKKQMINLTDEQLVARFRAGNNAAVGELYSRYYNKVYARCISLMKNADDAFDMAQDALLKAFEKIGQFKGNSTFSTWLFSITTNQCLEELRKRKNKYYYDINEARDLVYEEVNMEEVKEKEQKAEAVKVLMTEIPEVDRKMLLMKYKESVSVRVMQHEFGLRSESAVKMRLARARQKMTMLYETHYTTAA